MNPDTRADLLIELGTEELPPKALKVLMNSFKASFTGALQELQLPHDEIQAFATPRRLALIVPNLASQQPTQDIEKRGPSVAAAKDAEGNLSRAAAGFMKSVGVSKLDQLEQIETEKGAYLVYRESKSGAQLADVLEGLLVDCLARLPIERRMRWGSRRSAFVRPVHWLVTLYGHEVLPVELFGVSSGAETRGHRFMSPGNICLASPADYQDALRTAHVIADFTERRELIHEQLLQISKSEAGEVVIDPALLDEVTALVEWPRALVGVFSSEFMSVPEEALISAMKSHQRYFHLLDSNQRLLPKFVTIANIDSINPATVIAGNERVIAPRLSDAAFFFNQDRKTTLEAKLERLKQVVFQASLGTYHDKADRISKLAGILAGDTGADATHAMRAGILCKADLVSDMVSEFTDLQGLMGGYYARHDGEAELVCDAIAQHYQPTASGGELPVSAEACCVAIADKLDTLTGLFGIGQPPTGSKDPFALRRQTLGIIRMCIERKLDIDLHPAIRAALAQHGAAMTNQDAGNQIYDYFLERLANWYQDQDIRFDSVNAIRASSSSITRLVDADERIRALNQFRDQPEALLLIAANKRIANILRKADLKNAANPDPELFAEPAEQALLTALEQLETRLADTADYSSKLKLASGLQVHIDRYFDDVMVMSDDAALRQNRLVTLYMAQSVFRKIADFAALQ